MKKKKQDLTTIQLSPRNKAIIERVIEVAQKNIGKVFISPANVINSALDLISLENSGWILVRKSIEAKLQNKINLQKEKKGDKHFKIKGQENEISEKIGGTTNE